VALAHLAAISALAAQPSASEPITFFCSAPLRNASQLILRQSGSTHRVRGRIRVGRSETIPDPSRPLPMDANVSRGAEVAIRSRDYSADVKFGVVPSYGAGPREGGGGVAAAEVAASIFAENAPAGFAELGTIRQRSWMFPYLNFEIVVQGNRVAVDANGRHAEFSLDLGSGAVVELSCRGGDFSFEDIEVGG
jgi:hypothetical protein